MAHCSVSTWFQSLLMKILHFLHWNHATCLCMAYPTCRCDTSGIQAATGLCLPFGPVGSHSMSDVGHGWVPPIHSHISSSRRDVEPAHPSCGAVDQPAQRALHRGKPAGAWSLSKGRLFLHVVSSGSPLFSWHWYSSFVSPQAVLGWTFWWGPSGVDWLWGVCSGGRRNWSHPIHFDSQRPGVQVLCQVQDFVQKSESWMKQPEAHFILKLSC